MSSALEHWQESFEKRRQSAIDSGDWHEFAGIHSYGYWGSLDDEMARLAQMGKLEIPVASLFRSEPFPTENGVPD